MVEIRKIPNSTVLNSLGWKILERFCSQGVNLIIQIILARLLSPADFGSLAIMVAITNYAALFVQSGLATAIVQKKDLDAKDINTLFTASLVIAAIMYMGLFAASGYIAGIYDAPEIIWPLRSLALILFLNAINSVQTALFSRNMQFRQLFLRSIIAVPLSGIIGVAMAYMGFGLWALVAYTLSSMGLTVLVMSLASSYRLRLEFYWDRAKVLYSFSVKILLSSLVCGFGDTLRTLIIGKKYNSTDLAYYDKAYTYSAYFTQIINASITSVLLPTFSRSQDNISELRQMARRSVQLTAFAVIPMLTLVMCIADPFVKLLLTEKWAPSIPFLIIFCILRMPGCIASVDKQVYFALGNSKINLYYEIGLLVANVGMLLFTVPKGVFAIALGYLVIELLGCFFIFCISASFYGYSLLMRLADTLRPILNSVIVYFIISMPLFTFSSRLIEMIVKVCVGVILYLILCSITKEQNLKYITSIIINKLKMN